MKPCKTTLSLRREAPPKMSPNGVRATEVLKSISDFWKNAQYWNAAGGQSLRCIYLAFHWNISSLLHSHVSRQYQCVRLCAQASQEAHSKAPTANPNGHGEFPHRWPYSISVFADEYISSRSADITGDKQAIFPTLHYTASHFNMYLRACVCAPVIIIEPIGTVRDFLTKFNLQDDIRLYKYIYIFTHKSMHTHTYSWILPIQIWNAVSKNLYLW